jgi:DNA-binding CsgD family transcriptional regulator
VRRARVGLKIPTETLTRREIEVMTLTALGDTRSEVSEALSVSEETIKAHVENACRKLHAANKTHAITIAMTLGLIEPYPRPVIAKCLSGKKLNPMNHL